VLARRGLTVQLWVHDAALAARMARTRFNETYLPGFPIPDSVQIGADLHRVLEKTDAVVFTVPSHTLRGIAGYARPYLEPGACLISATKGIEEGSLSRMSEVLSEVCGPRKFVALSGPSFAREVAEERPTALVAASCDLGLAQEVQQLFSGARFRVYASTDVIGVELGGAVKNVIAIAAGVCHGLQLGNNAVAALITRGLAEMSRLGVALRADPMTLAGLAGLGDLVLTCTGDLSRNRTVGIQLAQGQSLAQITQGTRTVAEGVKSTNSVVKLGRQESVSLPISEQMYAVLHAECSPMEAMGRLMERSPKRE